MKKIQRGMMKELFPNFPVINYVFQLRKMLEDCESILDIGSGDNSPLRFVKSHYAVGVEGYKASMETSRKKCIHDKYILGDVKDITKIFRAKEFDACVALDVIEHLHKKDGYKMLKDMEKLARKKVVIFTPNGFIPQIDEVNNLQNHISGWTAQEMRDVGFTVYGKFGHKALRGQTHFLKYRPKYLWGFISELSTIFYTGHHPESSAALLCVKELRK